MNTLSVILSAGSSADIATQASRNVSDHPSAIVHPTLSEIQIRAYRIHQQHGGYFGGYSLDDWLEAEHELDDELHQHDDVAPRGERQRGAGRRAGLVN